MPIIAPQLFPFLGVCNSFIDFFFLPSVVSLLDVSSASTSNLQRFCRISHNVARSHFSSKSGRAFRPGGSLGGFAPYAHGRPDTQRRRARRPFGIYKRHVGPNCSDVSALGAWLFYDLS